MRKIILFLFTVVLLLTLTLPFSAESLGTEELEDLLDYVPYSAHENLTLENTEETRKTDPFVWAFIQECVDEFGIDTTDRRYWTLSDYSPGLGYDMKIPEGEIFYAEEQLQDVVEKMYNTRNIALGWPAGGPEYKTIYVPYEIGGFLFDFESGKYVYSNLNYLGGDFGNLTPYEYSKAVDCQISGEELYIYEKYAVFYKTADLYFIYGVLDHDTFYADGDHSNMYEIASGEALSQYTYRNIHLDPVYQKLFGGEMDDELALYKHTYKKNENGDWYWSSSKLVSVGEVEIPDTADRGSLYPLLALCSVIVIVRTFTARKRTEA